MRLLVFGIDAGTLALVRPWVAQGELPTLGRLMREGASGVLESVPNMITPAAWTSFATGCNPGRHGIFFFTERVPGSYAERFVQGGARAVPPFWMLLGDGSVRAAIVNVPMTFPVDPLSGVMVSGMDAPGPDAPGFTHPPELIDELRGRFGDLLAARSLSGAIGHLMLAGKVEEAQARLIDRVQARTALARYLLDRFHSDLAVLVHTEVDGAQHYFWRYLDPRLPGTDPERARRYGDVILRLYREVDRSLEALLAAYAPDAVMVISDHGAGASPGIQDGVPWIRLVLEQMGLAVRSVGRDPVRRTASTAVSTLYRTLNPRLPRVVRQALRRGPRRARDLVRNALRYQHDWPRTRAFCMGASGDIWLNVRGRDPDGVVEEGAEYQAVRERIRDTFMGLRDAATAERVVEAVLFREDVYTGPFVERAPDLFIRFKDVVIGELLMDGKVLALPRQRAGAPKDVKSGSHRPDGMILLAGQGIQPGVELSGASLIDVAPTILYSLGAPVPAHMDGRVLLNAFVGDYVLAHPVRRAEAGAFVRPENDGYDREDAEILEQRLRDLGYV